MIVISGGGTGDITAVVAGDGLSGGATDGSATLNLDLNELTAAAVADGDFIPIIDTNDSNGSRKEAVADLATLFAGDGITASNSVLAVNVDDSTIETNSDAIRIKDNGVSLAKMAGLTRGSMIIGNASGDPSELTKGSANYVLTSDGTDIAWAAAGGMTSFQLEDDDGTEVTISDAKEVKIIGSGVTTNWTDTDNGTDGDPYDLTITVDAAQTGITSLLATDIKIGEDDQTKVDFETADEIHFYAANVHQVKLVDNAFTPQADSDVDLGASGTYWKDAFIDKISTTGDIELGHASDTTIARSASGVVTIEGNIIKTVGTEDMWIPAGSMRPTDTNGCATLTEVETTATRPDMQVLDFDSSTQEYAQFSVAMPKSWNEGTVTAQFYWTHATAVDTDVIWAIQGVCVSDNDTIDVAYGTAQTVTDTFHNTAEDLAITAATSAITLGGTPAAGDLAFFQVYRDADAGGDTTNSTDARLIGVKINYTTNAATDA